MKILSLVCVIIFSQCIVAQEESTNLELLTWAKNYSSSHTITYTMQNAGGQIWAQETHYSPMYLTDNYQSAEDTIEENYCGGFKGFNQC